MPFLLVIFFLDSAFLDTTWSIFLFVLLANKYYFVVIVIVFLSFFVKLPLYGFHLWLPKAHVEAPVGGSIILAAVLLKLGAYGVYRFLFLLLFFSFFFDFLVLISFWGAFLCRIICLRQPDIKSLVAYSSISHIGVLISGYFIFGWFSTVGALLILLAHGFCSSCLFFLVNFMYERNLTRQLMVSRGQIMIFYYVASFWFLFLAINFGAPPFLNLLGEILILFNTGLIRPYVMLVFGLVRFFVAAYCMFLFRTLLHGQIFKFFVFFIEMDGVFLVFFFHLFPLIILVLKIELFGV
jgi:NADH-ubiquinone oxidoreductase chain 4